jgi:hypothetical protein
MRADVVVDSLAAAQAVVAHGRAHGHRFAVMIEVDTDGHRAGISPGDALLLEVGRTLHEGGADLRGVMTHAGASYECRSPEALRAMAEQERSRCVHAAERLRAAGLPCPEVSVGSTPTALSAAALEGVTEVRAGVYVFHDLVMLGLGVCRHRRDRVERAGHRDRPPGRQGLGAGGCRLDGDEPRPRHARPAGGLWLRRGVRRADGTPIDGLVMAAPTRSTASWPGGRAAGRPAATCPTPAAGHAAAHPAQPRLRHGGAVRPLRGADGRRQAERWPRFSGW